MNVPTGYSTCCRTRRCFSASEKFRVAINNQFNSQLECAMYCRPTVS